MNTYDLILALPNILWSILLWLWDLPWWVQIPALIWLLAAIFGGGEDYEDDAGYYGSGFHFGNPGYDDEGSH